MPAPIYRLLDCGDKEKVELFGSFKLIRPCPQALWPKTDPQVWEYPDSVFIRTSEEKGYWQHYRQMPHSWQVQSPDNLIWHIEPNEFGNVGVFTEHWLYTAELATWFQPKSKILNLFTYAGSNCILLAQRGFSITAVDSSRQAMTTYRTNLRNNNIATDGQRLILEDVLKFVAREVRRQKQYQAIMVDAPSYGRGTKGEIFRIEDHLVDLLQHCKQLMAPEAKLVLTLHSPRFTPMILQILCQQIFTGKTVETQELVPRCASGVGLPSGFLVKVF